MLSSWSVVQMNQREDPTFFFWQQIQWIKRRVATVCGTCGPFFVNGIDDASKKKSAFFVIIGPATYALLRNHVSPDKPGDKCYNQLVSPLKRQYNPTLLELVQHSRFHSCFMKQGDTVATLVCELHSNVGRVL